VYILKIILGGSYGFLVGIFKSAREMTFRNRPKKLLATSVLNMVGKQSSKFANAGASFAVLYYFTKQITNYTFDEELQNVSDFGKNVLFGCITGIIYKSTRGLQPALLAGTLAAIGTAGIYKYRKDKKTNTNKAK
jgi:hypothetical protein